MARETEALQAWIEVCLHRSSSQILPFSLTDRVQSLVYELDQLSPSEAELLLAGQTAQLKAHAGIVLEHVVREAVQLMGGIGLTRGGRGERVERIWRDVKAITVPGGSEEVLLDFAVKRAFKIQDSLHREKAKL